MNNIYVIDAMSFVHAGYSIAKKSENPLNFSGYLLKKMLMNFMNKGHYGEYFVCWEGKKSLEFRRENNTEYKATRAKDTGVFDAAKLFKKTCEELGFTQIRIDGFEADDAIHALCKNKKRPDNCITILSRDRDLLQTVQKGYADYEYDFVQKKNITVPKYSIVKMKALVGDNSDNIKGVTGVGKKKAEAILNEKLSLTDDQLTEYENALLIIDIEKNPRFFELETKIKEILTNN